MPPPRGRRRCQRGRAGSTDVDVLPLALSGRQYVAAAYLVFLALVLLYVVIISSKIARIEREVDTLAELADKRVR